jgi:hypothetical protein
MTTSTLARILHSGLAAALLMAGTSAVAQSNLSASTVNGKTTVTWKGQEVFSAPTKGPVSSRSVAVNGEEYAAAFAGDTVIWENVPGAAEKVKAATKGAEGAEGKQKRPGKRGKSSAEAGISVSTANGQTTVTWKGRQVFVGQTKGQVSGKSKSLNGKEFAAAFDGDKVLWESAPGAAQMVK